MGREVKRLSARTVATLTIPGRHADGDGLYLIVDASGAKRWLFMFRWAGKLKEMGLGGLASVSLADAREKALAARRTLASGLNPIDARRGEAAAKAEAVTFGLFADQLMAELRPGFRNAKHADQWEMTLTKYAALIRPKLIDEIRTDDILAVLKPLWATKQETASRLRGRIERVLDAAKARGVRTGENPARWRGHLDQLLPRRQKLARGHHAALPYKDLPAFMERLREGRGIGALALEFTILNASRTGEIIGARWSEIDRAERVWTIPATRMKAGREHRVPLTDRSVTILDEVVKLRGEGDYVFPGQRVGSPLSNMSMDAVLRRMEVEVTVHGFRSTFRDWAGEETSFPRDLAELALAHVVGDDTERAYRRGDALEKRRKLMEAWATFIGQAPAGNVIQLTRQAS